MSTQPTEAHRRLVAAITNHDHEVAEVLTWEEAAQLIADSEARAVEAGVRAELSEWFGAGVTEWKALRADGRTRAFVDMSVRASTAETELTRLRAEVERWKTVAAEMSRQREHNANERDRADAEVAALKKVLLEFGQLPSTPR
jgi:hypothetical protein